MLMSTVKSEKEGKVSRGTISLNLYSKTLRKIVYLVEKLSTQFSVSSLPVLFLPNRQGKKRVTRMVVFVVSWLIKFSLTSYSSTLQLYIPLRHTSTNPENIKCFCMTKAKHLKLQLELVFMVWTGTGFLFAPTNKINTFECFRITLEIWVFVNLHNNFA